MSVMKRLSAIQGCLLRGVPLLATVHFQWGQSFSNLNELSH